MKTSRYLLLRLCLALSCLAAHSHTAAQHVVDIKINADAVKKIKFDFTPPMVPISEYKKMKEAPVEKDFLNYRLDMRLPREVPDSFRVKRHQGYIRLEPYTIWTTFGEDPIYDVLYAGAGKRWEIHWSINVSAIRKQYRNRSRPSAGMAYDIATGSAGVGFSIPVDFDKFFFETFTKRGRAIRHNRTHAVAWKTYDEYVPTVEDNRKFPTFAAPVMQPSAPVKATETDTVPSKRHLKRHEKGVVEKTRFKHTSQNAHDEDLSRLLEERRRQDSIQRHDRSLKEKYYDNPYEIQRKVRAIEELQR